MSASHKLSIGSLEMVLRGFVMRGRCRGMDAVKVLSFILISSFIVGCSSLPKKFDGPSSRDELRVANHAQALVKLEVELDETGKDRFLYLAGAGLIKNLHGDFDDSNGNLEEAVRLAEELQTKRARNLLKVALTSPSSGDYAGTVYERAYLHYYKALNYLMLAAKGQGVAREEYLEGARIEARRADNLLTYIQNTEGSYGEANDRKRSTFKKLITLLRGLRGRTLDSDWLVFREDAYIRYMEGVIYESNGEYDNARIAYQRAAKLYEEGYAKQYGLGAEITELAWFDTIRMMQWAGGYGDQWPSLAKNKLSEGARERLKSFKRGTAQLLIITHAGFVPERKEMSLHLRLDVANKELVIRPSVVSNDLASAFNDVDQSTRNEQLAWFEEMYSDRGLLAVVRNFQKRGYYGALNGLFEKRTSIAPLWDVAESIGLVDGMSGMGTTVEVPYYASTAPDFGDTEVWLDGLRQGSLVNAESLANIALQEQLLNAGIELQLALARELTKVIICSQAAKELGGGLQGKFAEKACIVVFGSLSSADTRNWLMLPHTIKIQRYPVTAGSHTVRLVTFDAEQRGVYHQQEEQFEVEEGDIYLLRSRALSASSLLQQMARK